MELVLQRHDNSKGNAPISPSLICGEAALCYLRYQVFGEVPFDDAALLGGKVDHVRAGGGVVTGDFILPIGPARANGIEEMAKVREGRSEEHTSELQSPCN